jgi:hypothetical protein
MPKRAKIRVTPADIRRIRLLEGTTSANPHCGARGVRRSAHPQAHTSDDSRQTKTVNQTAPKLQANQERRNSL